MNDEFQLKHDKDRRHKLLVLYYVVENLLVMILACSALGKLAAAGDPNPVYQKPDPVISELSRRQVDTFGGALELTSAAIVAIYSSRVFKTALLGFWAAAFSAYRLMLEYGNFPPVCGCTGKFWTFFGISTQRIHILDSWLFWCFIILFIAYTCFNQRTLRPNCPSHP